MSKNWHCADLPRYFFCMCFTLIFAFSAAAKAEEATLETQKFELLNNGTYLSLWKFWTKNPEYHAHTNWDKFWSDSSKLSGIEKDDGVWRGLHVGTEVTVLTVKEYERLGAATSTTVTPVVAQVAPTVSDATVIPPMNLTPTATVTKKDVPFSTTLERMRVEPSYRANVLLWLILTSVVSVLLLILLGYLYSRNRSLKANNEHDHQIAISKLERALDDEKEYSFKMETLKKVAEDKVAELQSTLNRLTAVPVPATA